MDSRWAESRAGNENDCEDFGMSQENLAHFRVAAWPSPPGKG